MKIYSIQRLLFAAGCLGAGACAVLAQVSGIDPAVLRGAGLVAAITGQIGETPVFGAGIVFAREKDRLYIATANHVVRQGGREAGQLQVKLRNWPDKPLDARLLPQAERELDVAVLTVEDLAAHGVDPCALSLDRLAPPDAVKRGAGVLPIGNPNGVPWVVPVRTDDILEVHDNQVVFESARIARGHSGGALIGADGQLFGMIQADEPPNGRALAMRALIQVLESWNLPVHLRVPAGHMEGQPDLLPLIGAVRHNDAEDLRRLLGQACTDVNSGGRVLAEAVGWAGMEILNILLQAGADVNPRTGTPPIELAAARGDLEKARVLIAHGANVNSGGVLAAAANNGRLEIVKLLLANGANPNQRSGGSTALHAALGHEEIESALIQAGADVNAKYNGYTPLMRAVELHHPEDVRILLHGGANPAVRLPRNGKSLLEETDQQEIAAALLERSTTIGAEESSHLLHLSAQQGWADVASLVVQRGFNVKGDVGRQTLQETIAFHQPDVMRVLLEAGADPNAMGPTMQTALQYAVSYDPGGFNPATRLEIIQLLVSHGAKVNFDSKTESTPPIRIAIYRLPAQDLETVEFLLAHGAVVTPDLIDFARQLNRPDLVALLLKARRLAAPAKK